jgi:hypothetical protein
MRKERKNMRTKKKINLEAVAVMCLLAGLTANSSAKLNPMQESLRGVQAMTVDIVCSEGATEAGLNQQDIRDKLIDQLEQTGIKIIPGQFWQTAPGRCRLKVLIKVYKPSDLKTFIYNLKVYFIQTVALERIPESKIDTATWELSWLGHGSKDRLAESVPANLKSMIDSFIRDYRTSNSFSGKSSDTKTADNVSVTSPKGLIHSDVTVSYKYVSSKNSQVFHRPNCRSAKRIKPENLIGYNSREEAIQAGKRPCKVCKP